MLELEHSRREPSTSKRPAGDLSCPRPAKYTRTECLIPRYHAFVMCSLSSTFELRGENDGKWMYQAGFINKCLDVLVEGTASAKGNKRIQVTPTQKKHEGRTGHVLVDSEYTTQSIIHVYGLPRKRAFSFPGSCLKPSRIGKTNGMRVDQCIEERVVIIGPDHSDDHSRMGEYGRVTRVLGLNAPVDHAVVQHLDSSHRFYHWKCLCVATNEDPQPKKTMFPAQFSPDEVCWSLHKHSGYMYFFA
ncbi:hypothetical protein FB45DRAFT_1030427 [Roridomyces roridus]|uniref:Uncharacterized protein n=1 Tax=Roridomyces roridus TaxID=1738132 RepID=A0AAD7BP07_9AGAR|nr:hypothetical protein FB45DRAFT_1030427 [Roridomyces roridus]